MGARPLRRVIQTEVEDTLSEALLEGRIHDGEDGDGPLRDDKLMIEPQAAERETNRRSRRASRRRCGAA